MQKILFILSLVLFASAQTYSTTNCKCEQLLSQSDCKNLEALNCDWDSTKNKCTTSSTVTPTNSTNPTYCDQFSQTDCPNITGCAWVSSKCTFFTGCTPFAGLTDSDCQSISSICITDGIHCVEKNTCKTYMKQKSCKINLSGTYCFWDATNNICVDVNTCAQLPFFLSTDQECRNQIYYCTVKLGGGCQESGINCSDQNTDISCVWNKSQTQSCFWNGTQCQDRICSNAPNILVTDDACKSFLSDGSCTTKSGGGCITRTTCEAAVNHAACLTNSNGQLCYWNGTACVDKICTNAPATMTTNSACQGFISTCITTGAGCTTNGSCSAATVQAACDKNINGNKCIWINYSCQDKICINAPSTNNTHDLCTSYLETCTVNNSGTGCVTKTCDNAPIILTRNDSCEAYLPGSYCVAKSGGGCVTNGACSSLGQVACVKDINGNDCFWDTACKDKTCVNAPYSANTHDLCQAYMKTCTINSSGTCVNLTCENIQTSDACNNDFNGNPCIYKSKCYQIQCAQATTQTTHADCQTYSTQCTLNNSGNGCVEIPLTCSAITLQAACVLRQSPTGTANCGWNGLICIDQDCTTIDKSNTTSAACNTALTGCVSANPIGITPVAGCMALPITCAERQTLDNCEVAGGFITCLWNAAGSGSCVQKSCLTASITTTRGFISTFANSDCDGYMTGCFTNNTEDGCMARVTVCSNLMISTNCNYYGVKIYGDQCYWNSYACVDRICANVAFSTHSACFAVSNICTVNSTKTNCQAYAACNSYTIQDQCHVNASGKSCFWNGTVCRDEVCTDADTTYKTPNSCAARQLSGTTQCNVIARVSNQGCMTRQSSCSGYTEQSTCVKDISDNNCYWQGCTCWLQSAFTCANIYLSTYGLTDCEGVDFSCKNNDTIGCMDKVCSDYTKTDGTSTGFTAVASDSDCSNIDLTCTIDVSPGSVQCQMKQANCSSYKSSGTCTFSTTDGSCYWDGTVCAKATTCAQIFLTTYNAANCEGVKSSCINNGGTACQDKVCADYTTQNGLTGGTAVSTDAHCSALLNTCTIDNTTGAVQCQTKSATCNYASAETCKYAIAIIDGACYWNTAQGTPDCEKFISCAAIALATFNAANCEGAIVSCTNDAATGCKDKVCSDYTTQNGLTGGDAVSTEAHCSALLPTCTIDKTSGAVKCQIKQTNCSDYTALGQGACTFAMEGTCYWTGSACTKLTATTCTGIILSTYNAANCENVITTCINNQTTACQTKVCSDYSTQNGLTGGAAVYTDAHCSALLNSCTIDSTVGSVKCQTKKATCSLYTTTGTCTYAREGACYWSGIVCVLPSYFNCASKTGSLFTDATCANYFSGCTANAGATACQARAATCSSQTTPATCVKAVQGDCIYLGSVCVKKTCDNAPTTYNTDGLCYSYLSSCTIARGGGCIIGQECNSYTSQLQCTFNAYAWPCYWSNATYTCLDMMCSNLDQTTSYNTHTLCNGALNTCTVRAVNGAAVNGCQSLSPCSFYTIQDQCHINELFDVCEWNINLATPACVDRSCTSAPSSNTTHDSCKNHNGINSCTVGAVAGTNGAANTVGGCIALLPCASYIDSEQCHINAFGDPCGWNGTVCADYSCTTSPQSNNNDALCQSYKAGCTVDQSGSGCMALLQKCELYQIQANCVIDILNDLCYWNDSTNTCVTKTCDNAPDSVASAGDCNTYLAGCTMDSVKCKTKICEDFQLTTDALCRASLSNCTTDGMKCVLRGTCFQALDQTGCVTDNNGNQCEWVPAANASAQPYCTLKTCLTAPTINTTESQCASYFTNCTTKNGGGCVTKSTCTLANVQAACTTASDGTKCQWDTTVTPNACRNKDCQDYQGSTHSACQAISTTCTAGTYSNCARIKSCSNTTVRGACIQGTDGPCLWIAGVTNSEGTSGACYPYTSCKSLTWNSDNKCKLISPNCTTNGQNCIGISLCSETNISGGCVTGYDGNCIQIVSALGSTDAPVCKAFTSCKDAFYITHSGCQTANYKCTTNGTTGCISLSTCSIYNQAGCYLNAAGLQTTNGKVTSTGVCTWDYTNEVCRDQSCSDLTGKNHAACQAQLSTCTSDGTSCLSQVACGTYTQAQCGVAMGTDGICFWQVASATVITSVCRVMTCADVIGGTTTDACQIGQSSCVSNGTSCIAKANCSTYTTKTSCNSGGLDGICFFTVSTATGATAGTGTCGLMTSCASASNDSYACNLAKSRCQWTAASGSGTTAVTSKCATHTCASYYETNNVCANFLNWGQTLQQICQIKTGVCKETDPTTLSQTDCYSVSSYTYTWNTSTSKCGVCTTSQEYNNTTNNNASNNTNNDTNITTKFEFTVSLMIVVIGYLVL